jgi:ADP-dependent NAD(P)H-hydrate dehydratase / NAD(P)H-hydrate epimerase
VMLKQLDTVDDLSDWLQDGRLQTFVLGPGFGIGEKAKDFVLALNDRSLVLDADGITSFKDEPQALFDAFSGGEPRLVLTPHEGEFARLFPDLAADETLGKIEKARKAAERAHAAIVYKGADTVIASADGRATINANGPPWLATAGSGDVLAGMIGALLAQGMPAFEAAAAGVYLHGEAAHMAGPGITAEDLVEHAGRALARIAGAL